MVDRPSPTESRLSHALSYAILLGGFLTIAVTVYMVVATYSGLPYWDEWGQVAFVADGGSPLSPVLLWRQVNEHQRPPDRLAGCNR